MKCASARAGHRTKHHGRGGEAGLKQQMSVSPLYLNSGGLEVQDQEAGRACVWLCPHTAKTGHLLSVSKGTDPIH